MNILGKVKSPCFYVDKTIRTIKIGIIWGTWAAQLVERQTLAQVVISQFGGSSPVPGSVLTARSPEPASDSVSSSPSAPLSLMLCLSLSLKINK